jgi:hypothetical protein
VTALPERLTVAWLRQVDGGGRTIVVDPVEFFTGTAAERERHRDGKDGAGDTYVRNPSIQQLRVTVASSVAVTVNEMSNGGPTDVRWTWSRLAKVPDALLREGALFRLRTVKGQVASLSQQYQP